MGRLVLSHDLYGEAQQDHFQSIRLLGFALLSANLRIHFSISALGGAISRSMGRLVLSHDLYGEAQQDHFQSIRLLGFALLSPTYGYTFLFQLMILGGVLLNAGSVAQNSGGILFPHCSGRVPGVQESRARDNRLRVLCRVRLAIPHR